MYPLLTSDWTAGAVQLLFYGFTVVMTAVGYLVTCRG